MSLVVHYRCLASLTNCAFYPLNYPKVTLSFILSLTQILVHLLSVVLFENPKVVLQGLTKLEFLATEQINFTFCVFPFRLFKEYQNDCTHFLPNIKRV
jgi:hypothetical protein